MPTFRCSRVRQHLFGLIGSALILPAFAQVSTDLADTELQRQRQREEARRRQDEATPDVRLQSLALPKQNTYPGRETPCFVIRKLALGGDEAGRFQWALAAAAPALGRCLGSSGINVVLAEIQNALVERGFVTTRILADPQDLRTGNLRLTLVPGKIRAIRFADASPFGGYAGALPARGGDILNLRAIEQGLENFKRVPGNQADIQIVPGAEPGESDLVIRWAAGRGYRINLSADDSGSRSTGKYQGGITVSLDSPVGLQDLFYASFNRNLPGDNPGGAHGTEGYTLHYSVPFGYWLASLQVNDYRYRQTVAGATQDYIYRGTSTTSELKLALLVYRDAARKSSVSLRAYQRRSNNFIDDTEVEVQRRQMGGFALGLHHKEFIGSSTLDAALTWKVGTSSFGTMPAPEEQYGEGTARPRLFNAEINLNVPLGRSVFYQAAWRGQWNRTPLVPQDRFAIGGRYTVRGFDGESSLSSERGSLLRNDLVWTIPATTGQLYVALDHGVVAGPGARKLIGTRLTGMAVGWRGQFGRLQGDFFVGRPLRMPAGLRTAHTTTGFNLNYEF